MFLPVLLLAIIITVLIWRPIWGLYVLAGIVFFSSGWAIYFSGYEWAKQMPWLAALNAPVADFIGLVLLLGAIVLLFSKHQPNWQAIKKTLHPMVWFYLAFLVVALISSFFAFDHNSNESFRYLLRFYVFPFVVFGLLPLFFIREPGQLLNVLKIWFWIGILVSLYGLSSLFVVAQVGWLRVTPYALFGLAPLGYNHNQIAEVLVTIAPLGIFLALLYPPARKIYLWGTGLIVLTALLTFSRAAWLTLILQAIFFAYFYKKQIKDWMKKKTSLTLVVGLLAVCLAGIMLVFLQSGIVSSSTTARLETTSAVWHYFKQAPFLGYGPGMYLHLVGTTWALVQEFGEQLDAHGFIQKILSETGLAGLAFWSAFFCALFYKLYKIKQTSIGLDQQLFLVMLMSAGGAIFFQLFNTSYFSGVMWMPVGVALTVMVMKEKENI